MTYHGRKDKFECDKCQRIEYVDEKFPKGRCYYKAERRIKHACEECRKSLPKNEQFEASKS